MMHTACPLPSLVRRFDLKPLSRQTSPIDNADRHRPRHLTLAIRLFAFAVVLASVASRGDRIVNAEPNVAVKQNWPEFRGPSGDGHADKAKVPLRWSEDEAIRWKTALPGRGWSSPVVWGNQVWVTTASDDGKQMFALCIDRGTGKVLQKILVFENEEPRFCHPTNSYASPTPVIESDRIYVHFGSYGTACLDTNTGDKLWERRDFHCDHWRGPGASPILHEGRIHVAFDGFDVQYVVTLNKHDGSTVWKADRNIDYSTDNGDHRKAYCTGLVITAEGQDQWISPSAEQTVAYAPDSGQELWRVSHGGMNVATRPLFQHGLVYITNGDSVGKIKPTLLAVRPDPELSEEERIVWTTDRSVPRRPSPVIVGDRLFMVGDDGVMSCLNAKNGEPIWRKRIPSSFRASPLVVDDRIYLFSMEGTTTVIAAGDEYQELAQNSLDDGCQASPAVSGNLLLVRTTTHLYAIE